MNNKTQQPTELTVHETPQDDASALIARAIDKNVSVDVMERLLTIRRELKQEKAKEEYDRAMASFQSECPTIVKTKEVKTKMGKVAYRYAPIESIVSQVKEELHKNGFSYSTNMELLDSGVKVSVKVTHAAGHSEITEMAVPLGNKTDIMSQSQVVAAAQTFAKRYAFCNAFGILTGDEDTDAAPQQQPAVEAAIQIPMINDGQIDRIILLLSEKGKTQEDLQFALDNAFHGKTIRQLTQEQAKSLIDKLISLPSQDVEPEIDLDEAEKAVDSKIADPYKGKSLSWLRMEISQLMNQGGLRKDFAGIKNLTREKAIEILQGASK